jgi:hypothetical protein
MTARTVRSIDLFQLFFQRRESRERRARRETSPTKTKSLNQFSLFINKASPRLTKFLCALCVSAFFALNFMRSFSSVVI